MSTSSKDSAAEQAFNERLQELTDGAFLTCVIGLSIELKLFDTMCEFSEPQSIAHIATAAGIKRR